MRRSLLWLPFAALFAPSALAAPPAGPACEFRVVTLQALFAAANETGRAGRALAASDVGGAQTRLAAAGDLLLAEKARVAAEGRELLGAKPRKDLLKALRGALRRARRAARGVVRRSPAGGAAAVLRASSALEAALSGQAAVFATQSCAGAELRVPELVVAAGETRSVPGGAVVVGELGVTVLGALAARGAGGLTLVAESGDLVLEGMIDARGDAEPPGDAASRGAGALRAAARDVAAADLRGAARDVAAPDPCGDAAPVRLEASAGDVRIGPTSVVSAPHGRDCARIYVDAVGQLIPDEPEGSYRAAHGGAGGDVIVTSAAGSIVFAPRSFPEGPFWPGDGGKGQSLGLSAAFAPRAGFAQLGLFGGNGGRSGRLVLTAYEGYSLPERLYGGGGIGGDGGWLRWNLPPDVQPFPSELGFVLVRGGDGGDGSLRGGKGGDAYYNGDRVVRTVDWDPPPVVEAAGGSGGSVFDDSPHSAGDDVYGGDGGVAEVIGNRGRDGTAAHPDGASGGDVRATGGSANEAAGPELVHNLGGRGGDAYGRSGPGGDGFSRCDAPAGPGGNGGAAGTAEVVGGDGGPAAAGHGGSGGSSLAAEGGVPGRGGDGQPAGSCGDAALSLTSIAGRGGSGAPPGVLGEAVAVELHDCEAEGALCEDTPIDEACAVPRSASARVIHRYSTLEDSRSEALTETCDPAAGCRTRHLGERSLASLTDPESFPPERASWDFVSTAFFSADPELFRWAFLAHCTRSGVLHLAGQSGTDEFGSEVVEHSCSGYCDCPPPRPFTHCCPTGEPVNPFAPCP